MQWGVALDKLWIMQNLSWKIYGCSIYGHKAQTLVCLLTVRMRSLVKGFVHWSKNIELTLSETRCWYGENDYAVELLTIEPFL